MSAPKFTPGPWRVSHEEPFEMSLVKEDGADVPGVDFWLDDACYDFNDEMKANARLIAAAPDLYEALRELRDAWCLNACDAASPDEGMNHLPECYAARDALAKAVAP